MTDEPEAEQTYRHSSSTTGLPQVWLTVLAAIARQPKVGGFNHLQHSMTKIGIAAGIYKICGVYNHLWHL